MADKEAEKTPEDKPGQHAKIRLPGFWLHSGGKAADSTVDIPEDAKSYYMDMLDAGCVLTANEYAKDKFCMLIAYRDVVLDKVECERGPEAGDRVRDMLMREAWLTKDLKARV